jgi:hypothetical protein
VYKISKIGQLFAAALFSLLASSVAISAAVGPASAVTAQIA